MVWPRQLLKWVLLVALPAAVVEAQQQAIFDPMLAPNAYRPSHITRVVEVGGSLTRSTTSYVLERSGSGNVEGEWIFAVKGQEGFVEGFEGSSGSRKPIAVTKLTRDDRSVTYYMATFPLPQSHAKPTISISTVTAHQSRPDPPTLAQDADTLSMVWSEDLLDSLTGMSQDDIQKLEELKVRVKTPTPRIWDVAGPGDAFAVGHAKGSAMVTFTSRGDLTGSKAQTATVHYEQPDAIGSIRKLNRSISVSHWGSSLGVMDSIDLVNSGPTLKGQFARIDYQKATMQRRAGILAIGSLSLVLPPRIHSPYYYDIVGNVSTSRFRPSADTNQARLPSQRKKSSGTSLLEIKPRYPLMGGWNYTFTVGYEAPLGDSLKKVKRGTYLLAVPFLTPIKDIAVDHVTLTISLPEGASHIKVDTPFSVDSLVTPSSSPSLFKEVAGYEKSYLDSTGRPTVILTKENCSDRHGASVLIEYTIPAYLDYLQKPVAVAAVLFGSFLFTIALKRNKWGIGE